MDTELFSIGDTASQSGLSVSSLRFYDRVGILNPAWVDPLTSYRWYSAEQVRTAKLISSLRRVGLALPEMSRIIEHLDDQETMDEVLQEHVRRLEQGLASAKSTIKHIGQSWQQNGSREAASNVLVSALELRTALKSVRFALGSDQQMPALQGVLLEVSQGQLRMTTSDRYRAAFASVLLPSADLEFNKVLDGERIDSLIAFLDREGIVTLSLGTSFSAKFAPEDTAFVAEFLDAAFPDLTNILPESSACTRAEVDSAWLREKFSLEPSADTWIMRVDEQGEIHLNSGDQHSTEPGILLGAEFLADAIEAADSSQLSLEMNGPVAPLAIRRTDNPSSFSVLMPMRREAL